MTFEAFDKLTDEMIKEVLLMRDTKGKEYANSDIDRLANFKEIATECGVLPLQVWEVYFKKHIRAIDNYVKTGKSKSTETIKSRFVDTITYLLLGYGLIKDEELFEKKAASIEDQIKAALALPRVGAYYLNRHSDLTNHYYIFSRRRTVDSFLEFLRFDKAYMIKTEGYGRGTEIAISDEEFHASFFEVDRKELFSKNS